MVTHLAADLRLTFRNLRKHPLFTCVAVLALGLGIGANAAIFSAVNLLLLGSMPYAQPDKLVAVWEDSSFIGFPVNTPAPANFFDWRRMNSVFSGMTAIRGDRANITGGAEPELVSGRRVMPNFLDILGTRPLYGRNLTQDEDRNNARVVLLSYGFWMRHFGGNTDLTHETLQMDNRAYQVMGVMPPAFAYPDKKVQYWRPIHFTPEEQAKRGNHYLHVIARLKPGVTVKQARANMRQVAAQLEKEYPKTNAKLGAVVISLRDDLVGDTGTALRIIFIAAGFVLLIACLNVANLVLARALDRRREFAVRAALGARRSRLVAQLLSESLLLSCLGALCGLILAYAGVKALQTLIPATLVNGSTLTVNAKVFGFSLLLTVLSGVLFGLMPALTASKTDLNDALKLGGRTQAGSGSPLLRDGLAVSQVACAALLLIGAGLMLQTLVRLETVDTGFRTDHLLTMETNLPRVGFETDEKRIAFLNAVQQRVRHLPGVQNTGFVSDLPFATIGDTVGFLIEGRPAPPSGDDQDALYREVTPGYLESLQARLIAGRWIDKQDRKDSTQVIVINETFAHRFWPNKSPLGDRVRFDNKAYTIVGVVHDIRERGLQWTMKPALYVPVTQVRDTYATNLAVRTTADPMLLARAVRDAVWSVDRNVPVVDVLTMDDYMELEVRARRQQMLVLAVFAALAVFLAALGIYGVLAYSVTQRRREIGVRMALGADGKSVVGMVLRHGFRVTLLGITTGIAVAFAGTRWMASLLFGVRPQDPLTFGSVAAVLAFVALFACLGPALGAARVDPVRVLHEE
ncbi:MAG TPA: ABC transporter permease [Bryobacteraceae bacterium]